MKHYVALMVLFSSHAVFAAGTPLGNHAITEFKYTSCAKSECVVVKAPKAWLSLLGGGFTTDGSTELSVYDRAGHLKSSSIGENATYNPELELIMLEARDGSVVIHRLDSEKAKDKVVGGAP